MADRTVFTGETSYLPKLVLPQDLTASILSSSTLEDLRSLWDFLKTSGISFEQSGAAEICHCP